MLNPRNQSCMERDKRVHLHFRVPYMTRWGQRLILCGAGALLGSWKPEKGHAMRCHHEKDDLIWEVLVSLPWQLQYVYKYAIVHDGEDNTGVQVDKWEIEEHVIPLHPGLTDGDIVEVLDTWIDRSHPGSIYSTSAFTKVIKLTREPSPGVVVERKPPQLGEAVVRFRIADAIAPRGSAMCVSGSLPLLGNWQAGNFLVLADAGGHWYEAEIRVPYTQFPFTYKYALHQPDGVVLEVGEPRVAALPLSGSTQMGAPAVIAFHDGYFRREKLWRGAGVAIPVFSLRTQDSLGVGEFLDLIKLVDFADSCGMRLIQVLPVNDTSVYNMWWDSYPYSTLSVFALHPLYLAVRALRDELPPDLQTELASARSKVEGIEVDYEETMQAKTRLSRMIFNRYGHETLESAEFKAWFKDNASWLKPYAAFCLLRDLFQTSEHWQWGLLAGPASEELIDRLTSPEAEHARQINFTYYIQYHLHRQLLQVSNYAISKRVVLKGDVPIGVDKRSVDTWLEPHLFRMDKSTGSPPDYFALTGQNWGFPTYNWEEMAKDNYSWWQRRLRHMAQYFQAYRIDHILGFFRIWEIPGDCVTGLLGHFRPSLPIWRNELESRGIWDMERLTEPYIRWHLLHELFGKMAGEVAAKYLLETSPGCFKFRPQYASEQQISQIKIREDSPRWLLEETEKTRRGLMKLRQNVVLLQDPEDKDKFYPRFALNTSSSFKELDQHWRDALMWLHDDYYWGRQENVWRQAALKKLPVLMDATDMLVCGEDLGFVPACVPPVMQELGLIGLRIQRMATEEGKEFNHPVNYPYLTVASPSCHDVATTRAWYEEDAERRERFFYTTLGGCGDPPETCTPDVMRIIIQQHLACSSVWAIFPVQDLMALSSKYTTRPAQEEIINNPTVAKHYWRFRIHVPLEDLLADKDLVMTIQEMLLVSDRASAADLPALKV